MEKSKLVLFVLMIFGSFIAQAQFTPEAKTTEVFPKKVVINGTSKKGFLTFTSDDGHTKFSFGSRIFVDGAAFFDEDAYNPIGNGMIVRRARFSIKTKLYKNWEAKLDVDFAGSIIGIRDMYIGYNGNAKNWSVKVGQVKEAMSMETLSSSKHITFLERSLAAKFAPDRHLGVQGHYWKKHYAFTGGVHFNSISKSSGISASQTSNKVFGTNEGISFTGRLVFRPIIDKEKVLHIGAAMSYRTPKTTNSVLDSYKYSTTSVSAINKKKYLDSGTIKDVNNNMVYNVELAGAYKNIMFQGEYFRNQVNRDKELEAIQMSGFYMQAGYLLFGGKYNYSTSKGLFSRAKMKDGVGPLEVALRFDYLNLNDEEVDVLGGAANSYTLGLNYYINPNVRVMLNYSYINHDRFANGNGSLFVGHDANGALVADPSLIVEEKGDGGDDYSMLQARFQIEF